MSSAATVPSVSNPLAVLKPASLPRPVTLETYLRREERSEERHEYYNGQIKKLSMARGPHNEIAINIATAIKIAVRQSDTPYRIFGSNQKIYLPQLNISLYPDAVVVSEAPIYWDNNQVLLTNPLLIVEILSKSTRSYDRSGKFDEYKTLDSFKEYVLVEQDKYRVETRFREEPDLWRERVFSDLSEQIVLRSLNCTISMPEIYENVNN